MSPTDALSQGVQPYDFPEQVTASENALSTLAPGWYVDETGQYVYVPVPGWYVDANGFYVYAPQPVGYVDAEGRYAYAPQPAGYIDENGVYVPSPWPAGYVDESGVFRYAPYPAGYVVEHQQYVYVEQPDWYVDDSGRYVYMPNPPEYAEQEALVEEEQAPEVPQEEEYPEIAPEEAVEKEQVPELLQEEEYLGIAPEEVVEEAQAPEVPQEEEYPGIAPEEAIEEEVLPEIVSEEEILPALPSDDEVLQRVPLLPEIEILPALPEVLLEDDLTQLPPIPEEKPLLESLKELEEQEIFRLPALPLSDELLPPLPQECEAKEIFSLPPLPMVEVAEKLPDLPAVLMQEERNNLPALSKAEEVVVEVEKAGLEPVKEVEEVALEEAKTTVVEKTPVVAKKEKPQRSRTCVRVRKHWRGFVRVCQTSWRVTCCVCQSIPFRALSYTFVSLSVGAGVASSVFLVLALQNKSDGLDLISLMNRQEVKCLAFRDMMMERHHLYDGLQECLQGIAACEAELPELRREIHSLSRLKSVDVILPRYNQLKQMKHRLQESLASLNVAIEQSNRRVAEGLPVMVLTEAQNDAAAAQRKQDALIESYVKAYLEAKRTHCSFFMASIYAEEVVYQHGGNKRIPRAEVLRLMHEQWKKLNGCFYRLHGVGVKGNLVEFVFEKDMKQGNQYDLSYCKEVWELDKYNKIIRCEEIEFHHDIPQLSSGFRELK